MNLPISKLKQTRAHLILNSFHVDLCLPSFCSSINLSTPIKLFVRCSEYWRRGLRLAQLNSNAFNWRTKIKMIWQTKLKCKFLPRSMCDNENATKISAPSSRRNISLLLLQLTTSNFFHLCINLIRRLLFLAPHYDRRAFYELKRCLITEPKDVAWKYSIPTVRMTKTDESIRVWTVRKYLLSDWLSRDMKIPRISKPMTRLWKNLSS